jgi:hypothetical protein
MGSSHDTEFIDTGGNVGDAPRCPRCGDVVGMRIWLPPHRGELTLHGQDFGDFVRGPGNSILLSERFADAFRAEGLTGLGDLHPVEVVRVRRKGKGPKPTTVPRYVSATPVLGSAAIDEARSHIRRSEPISCDYCRCTGIDANHGFTLEAGSWQGEDIFRPRGLTGRHVVSERFARLVAQYGFTNVRLIPTEEVAYDYATP